MSTILVYLKYPGRRTKKTFATSDDCVSSLVIIHRITGSSLSNRRGELKRSGESWRKVSMSENFMQLYATREKER